MERAALIFHPGDYERWRVTLGLQERWPEEVADLQPLNDSA